MFSFKKSLRTSSLLIIIAASCRQREKIFLFGNETFDDKADWCVVLKDNYDKIQFVRDQVYLKKNYRNIWATLDEECIGTTSDYLFFLYKNGKLVNQLSYCSNSPVSPGNLQKNFQNGSFKTIKAYSKPGLQILADSLSRIGDIYLLREDSVGDYQLPPYTISYYQSIK